MPKRRQFKKGDRVELIAHGDDSSDNNEIGDVGIVVDTLTLGAKRPHVRWESYKICPDWFTNADCLDLFTISENE